MSGSRKVKEMRKRFVRCRVGSCERLPFLGGLCEEHYREDQAKSRRDMEARELLFRSVVDNEPLQNIALQEELGRLQRWWERASRELRSPGAEAVFGGEAEFAIEWCINLAAVMVEEERAARSGTLETSLEEQSTRQWVWERFRNLGLGMMSNGLPRP